jgi:hypothetical protein
LCEVLGRACPRARASAHRARRVERLLPSNCCASWISHRSDSNVIIGRWRERDEEFDRNAARGQRGVPGPAHGRHPAALTHRHDDRPLAVKREQRLAPRPPLPKSQPAPYQRPFARLEPRRRHLALSRAFNGRTGFERTSDDRVE